MAEGARIRAYDPQAMQKAKDELPDITYCLSLTRPLKTPMLSLFLPNGPSSGAPTGLVLPRLSLIRS